MEELLSLEMQHMRLNRIKVKERTSLLKSALHLLYVFVLIQTYRQDAYTLALILSSPYTTKDNIPRALKAYERARLNRANDIIRLSSESGRIHQ